MCKDAGFNRTTLETYLNQYSSYFMDIAEIEAVEQEKYLSLYGFYVWGKCDIAGNSMRNYEITLDEYIKRI